MLKFTDSLIFGILRQLEAGLSIAEICKQNGINQGNLYSWKSKSRGIDASMVKRLKELEEENRKFKQMYATLSLETHALKDLIKKSSKPC